MSFSPVREIKSLQNGPVKCLFDDVGKFDVFRRDRPATGINYGGQRFLLSNGNLPRNITAARMGESLMRRKVILPVLLLLAVSATSSFAFEEDPDDRGSYEEQQACTPDVFR